MGLFNRLIATALPVVPRPIVRRVASRYVAGKSQDDALETVQRLNQLGARATLDLLGEEVDSPEPAERATAEYLALLEEIAAQSLDSTISVKLTQLGLSISEEFCRQQVGRLAEAADARGNLVRIDMEDRHTTDATLAIYAELQARHGSLGCVLQAALRRTLQDIQGLPASGADVRLCKGIYLEPPEHAWQDFDTIRANYLAALEKLLRRGAYVGIATHDEFLIAGALALLDRAAVGADQYEFQMLLGVQTRQRQILLDAGHPVRVYVPYGSEWYAYSLRRLRENPEVAGHVMRAFWSGE